MEPVPLTLAATRRHLCEIDNNVGLVGGDSEVVKGVLRAVMWRQLYGDVTEGAPTVPS